MQLFLKRLMIFLIPIMVIAISLEILLRRIPNDYSYKRYCLENRSARLHTLILGNSHSLNGLNPNYLSVPAFNAASVSQTLEFDWAMFKQYLPRLPRLKLVIIPVDYFTLYTNLHYQGESWRIKNYQIYHSLNTSWRIADHFEILSNNLSTNTQWLKSYYLHKVSHRTCTALGWGRYNGSEKPNDLNLSGYMSAQRHLAKDQRYFSENLTHLKNIIALAKAKHIKVLLYTSPAYKTYTERLDRAQLSKTISTLRLLEKTNTNVSYHNFLTGSSYNANHFGDADHLNSVGARLFSLRMDSVIKSLKLQYE